MHYVLYTDRTVATTGKPVYSNVCVVKTMHYYVLMTWYWQWKEAARLAINGEESIGKTIPKEIC